VPAATEAPPNEPVSSKVYIVDGLRLRQAVSHLEGAGEVDKCLLLKLLLPTLAAGPRSFGVSSGGGMQATAVHHSLADSAQISCASQTSCPQQATQLLPSVEVSGNGDDFDQAGFEAVMEYLSTGQVDAAVDWWCMSTLSTDGLTRSLYIVVTYCPFPHNGLLGVRRNSSVAPERLTWGTREW